MFTYISDKPLIRLQLIIRPASSTDSRLHNIKDFVSCIEAIFYLSPTVKRVYLEHKHVNSFTAYDRIGL